MGGVLHAPVVPPADADLAGYDLVGFGSGIYRGSFHPDLRTFVELLPQDDGRAAFLFATSGLAESRFLRFSEPLVDALEHKGFDVVGGFSCRGSWSITRFGRVRRGKPDAADLSSARSFAEHVKNAVTEG